MSNPFAWLMKRIMWPGLLTLDAVFAKAKERGFQLAIFPDANHIHPWRAEIIRPARRVECDQRWWLLHRIDKEANGPTPLHAALSALCAIEHEVAKRDPISSKVPA